MNLRFEAFAHGFMQGMKPHLTVVDRELLKVFFHFHKPPSLAIKDEASPSKVTHYFRLRASHRNVLLPIWILNHRTSTKMDRFRILYTIDHSFIYDTKDKLIYDPTTEALHQTPEYKVLSSFSDWKDESASLIFQDMRAGTIKVCTFSERIETLPLIYDAFVRSYRKHELRKCLPSFRPTLDFKSSVADAELQAEKDWSLVEVIVEELVSRRDTLTVAG